MAPRLETPWRRASKPLRRASKPHGAAPRNPNHEYLLYWETTVREQGKRKLWEIHERGKLNCWKYVNLISEPDVPKAFSEEDTVWQQRGVQSVWKIMFQDLQFFLQNPILYSAKKYCIFAFFHVLVPDRRSPYRQFRIPRIVIPRFLNFAFQQNYCKALHKFVKYSQHCQNSFLNVLLEYSSWKVEMSKSLAAGNIDFALVRVIWDEALIAVWLFKKVILPNTSETFLDQNLNWYFYRLKDDIDYIAVF